MVSISKTHTVKPHSKPTSFLSPNNMQGTFKNHLLRKNHRGQRFLSFERRRSKTNKPTWVAQRCRGTSSMIGNRICIHFQIMFLPLSFCPSLCQPQKHCLNTHKYCQQKKS